MVKAVIFDIGGVLVTSSTRHMLDDLARYFGKSNKELRVAFFGNLTDYEEGKIKGSVFFRRIERELGVKLPFSGFRKIIWEDEAKFSVEDQRVLKIILALKKRYKVVGLTNIIPLHERYNEKRHLYDSFDHVYCSNRLHMAKPFHMRKLHNPTKIYRYVSKKTRIRPEDCIFIDDHAANLVPARKVGMKTIRFLGAKDLKEKLEKLGVIL